MKEIRTQIAAKNDIEYITSECGFQGECKGTCPKCEEELRYLENELRKRQQLGKVVALAGISLGVVGTCVAQTPVNDTLSSSIDTTKIEALTSRIEVSGKMIDTDGKGLFGAMVYEKGTNNGTMVWEDDGFWTLTVQSSASVLVFTDYSHHTQEISVGSNRNFNVRLSPETIYDGQIVGMMDYKYVKKSKKNKQNCKRKKESKEKNIQGN